MRRLLLVSLASAIWVAACASGPTQGRCPEAPAPSAPAPAGTASPSNGNRAIPYDLPKSGEVMPPPPADLPGATSAEMVSSVLLLDIDQTGAWSLNGKPVIQREDVTRAARDSLARDPGTRAVIRADRRASWGDVVSAIDLIKQGGIAKLAFAVSPLGQAP